MQRRRFPDRPMLHRFACRFNAQVRVLDARPNNAKVKRIADRKPMKKRKQICRDQLDARPSSLIPCVPEGLAEAQNSQSGVTRKIAWHLGRRQTAQHDPCAKDERTAVQDSRDRAHCRRPIQDPDAWRRVDRSPKVFKVKPTVAGCLTETRNHRSERGQRQAVQTDPNPGKEQAATQKCQINTERHRQADIHENVNRSGPEQRQTAGAGSVGRQTLQHDPCAQDILERTDQNLFDANQSGTTFVPNALRALGRSEGKKHWVLGHLGATSRMIEVLGKSHDFAFCEQRPLSASERRSFRSVGSRTVSVSVGRQILFDFRPNSRPSVHNEHSAPANSTMLKQHV